MRFMGDSPLRGVTEQEVISTFLKVKHSQVVHFQEPHLSLIVAVFLIFKPVVTMRTTAHDNTCMCLCFLQLIGEFTLMRDEAYCQLLKQLTANTSSKPDSCQRGWRLLYILTAFHRCSEVLKPFLLKYLQQASRSTGAQYQGIAKACEQNLKKTFQHGGRLVPPSSMELKAMMAGRSSKRQLFLFPGGIERHVKIKTCTVALEAVEELCYEMGLHRLEAMEEYAIFLVTNRGQHVRPLNKHEYILDVTTEAELVDSSYSLWFRRVIWTQPLRFENELCVAMQYNQILPDYRKGLLNVLPQGKVSDQQFHQISKLAALQHRAKDGIFIPSIHELSEYIAAPLFKKQQPQQWVTMVTQHMQQAQALNPHQARAQFLGKIAEQFHFYRKMFPPVTPLSINMASTSSTKIHTYGTTHTLLPVLFCIAVIMLDLCGAGADGHGPSGGGAVQPHPEAHSWIKLPLRGHHCGRHERTTSGPAAA
uniref:MyTH4 domain-containing protein n=1 Tax=Oryzias latipes TaxID=8090 RepID=A0A3P9KQ29_ORYLA